MNIFEWNYVLNFKKTLDERLQLSLKEHFKSTLQSISSRDLWKDNQNLTLSLSYPLSSKIAVATELFSHILTDPLSGFDNDVKFHTGSASLTYEPGTNISLTPSVSSRWQTQVEQSDHGLGYGINADISNLNFYGYENELSVVGEQDHFPQRKNHDFSLRYRVERHFYETTADTLVLFVNRLRRDSFDSDQSGIFVRNLLQSSQGIDNRLSYRLNSSTTLYLKNWIQSSEFTVNNVREDSNDVRKDDSGFEAGQTLNINFRRARWLSHFRWNYQVRTRDDNRLRESRPDPFGRFPSVGFDTEEVRVTLSMSHRFRASRSDSLALFASVSKFQYDTSDTTNPNDHDQLQWQLTFSHSHKLNQDLSLVWHASVFLKHFVFISSKFSSGNNWQRNFQFSPEIVYKPDSHFSFRQRFTVRAKYQTYDFDDPETSNRNSVNRQYIVTNKSSYWFSRNSRIEAGFNLELAEQGKFFYNVWRQRLALSWRNAELQLVFKRNFGARWQLASGANFFRQTRWEHRLNSSGERQKQVRDRHTNYGPVLELSYRPNPRVQVLFLGNVQISNSSRRATETINNFDLNVNWFF